MDCMTFWPWQRGNFAEQASMSGLLERAVQASFDKTCTAGLPVGTERKGKRSFVNEMDSTEMEQRSSKMVRREGGNFPPENISSFHGWGGLQEAAPIGRRWDQDMMPVPTRQPRGVEDRGAMEATEAFGQPSGFFGEVPVQLPQDDEERGAMETTDALEQPSGFSGADAQFVHDRSSRSSSAYARGVDKLLHFGGDRESMPACAAYPYDCWA